MIQYTIFKNIFDNKTDKIITHNDFDSFENYYMIYQQENLNTKKDAVLISPATYLINTTRANKNVVCWDGWCCVDVDDFEFEGDLNDALNDRFSNWKYVCYSTASSTQSTPKFRLVFPLTKNSTS